MASTSPRARTQRAPRASTGDNLKAVITIDGTDDEVQHIPVKLVGQLYMASPPKAALAMKIGQLGRDVSDDETPEQQQERLEELTAVFDTILLSMFGAEVAEQIQARLNDPTDRLDVTHIYKLVEAVSEWATANPTT